jgi:hypothetical protein
MTHATSAARPKESQFYLPLIYILGRLTGFKPYVGVPHEKVQDDVLRLAGLTVELGEDKQPDRAVDAEGNAWSLRSKNSQKRDGLYRVVHFAWYHQTKKYRPETETAYCAKYVDPALDVLRRERNGLLALTDDEDEVLRSTKSKPRAKRPIEAKIEAKRARLSVAKRARLEHLETEMSRLDSAARGVWALTERGVRKARELREIYEGQIMLSSGPNVTAAYIGENFERLYNRITLHLRRKMPRSEMFGKVEDHAATWIERIIQRDGLRKRIESGRSIAPSQACAWARRSAYTDIRNDGREPVCRVFHGALTRPEIGGYDPSNWTTEVVPRTINESPLLAVNTYTEHSEDDHVGDTIDNLADDHPSASVEETVLNSDAFDHVLGRLAEILHQEIDGEQDVAFHEQLVHDRYVKEMSLREIAEAHGLSDNEDKVNIALNRVRALMLRAREDGEFDEFLTR